MCSRRSASFRSQGAHRTPLTCAAAERPRQPSHLNVRRRPTRAGAPRASAFAPQDLDKEKDELGALEKILSLHSEAAAAVELLEEGGADAEIIALSAEIMEGLQQGVGAWERRQRLSLPHAEKDAVVTIVAGAGGTDAQVRRQRAADCAPRGALLARAK